MRIAAFGSTIRARRVANSVIFFLKGRGWRCQQCQKRGGGPKLDLNPNAGAESREQRAKKPADFIMSNGIATLTG
ncbi:hypothetical protein ACFS07_30825 [Undibacterium arcticum]